MWYGNFSKTAVEATRAEKHKSVFRGFRKKNINNLTFGLISETSWFRNYTFPQQVGSGIIHFRNKFVPELYISATSWFRNYSAKLFRNKVSRFKISFRRNSILNAFFCELIYIQTSKLFKLVWNNFQEEFEEDFIFIHTLYFVRQC